MQYPIQVITIAQDIESRGYWIYNFPENGDRKYFDTFIELSFYMLHSNAQEETTNLNISKEIVPLDNISLESLNMLDLSIKYGYAGRLMDFIHDMKVVEQNKCLFGEPK